MLTIIRNHSESGSITGTVETKRGPRDVDFSWGSHDLWINGRRNPEDHPLEKKANAIFEEANEQIRAHWRFTGQIENVPFTAKYTKAKGVHDLALLLQVDEKQTQIWDKDFLLEEKTFLELLTELPVPLDELNDNPLAKTKATKGTHSFILSSGKIILELS